MDVFQTPEIANKSENNRNQQVGQKIGTDSNSRQKENQNKSLTNCGNPIKKFVCLVPMNATKIPHKQFPASPPNGIIDAIHDISLSESLPVSNGLAFERSNGNAIDIQPIAQPPPIIIKLATLFHWKFQWKNFE